MTEGVPMADLTQDLGLLCRQHATFYACPHAEDSFVGCCTTDPCEDMSGIYPESDLFTATFDPNKPPENLSHECLGREWYTCPDLETPFVECCTRDACLFRCPALDRRAATLADDHALLFNMASAESTKDSASTKSTATTKTKSTGETTHTPSVSQSAIPTASDVPTSTTTPTPSPAEKTVLVPDPHGKDDLSDSQEVGIGVAAGVIGLVVLGCIAHKIIVHIRKRRPGYPHRTDHDPNWRPHTSPVELNSVIAPGTRKCGLDRVPGEATRPGSWEDENNNEAEAKFTGVPGPRRVRSAEPGGILDNAGAKGSEKRKERGQVSQYSLPLPATRGHTFETPRSAGDTASLSNEQHRPRGWVTRNEHAAHHDHYSDNGDFSVNIDGYTQGTSTDVRARSVHSANELRHHTALYHPAARSDDQLNRFMSYPPAAEMRPAPRSDGAGSALNLDQYPLRTYEPYIPPTEPAPQQFSNGVNRVGPPCEVYELAAEPVGKITDPRARTTLGDVCVVNPELARESTVIELEEVKDETEDKDSQVKGDTADAEKCSSAGGVKVEAVTITSVKYSDDEPLDPEEQDEKQDTKSDPTPSSPVNEQAGYKMSASEVANVLCSITTPGVAPQVAEKEPANQLKSEEAPVRGLSATPAPASEETPRLDATGGLPTLSPNNSRRTSTASKSFIMLEAQSNVRSEVTRPSSLSAGISSATGNPSLPSSSTVPNSLTTQEQAPALCEIGPSNGPRMLAAPRRQASELHMNIPADNGLRHPSHPSADRRPEGNVVPPLNRPQRYQGRYVSPPGRDKRHDVQQNRHYGGRYSTYPAVQPPTCLSHNHAQSSTTSHQSQPNHDDNGQADSQARQPYALAYHTRVYHPQRTNPPRPLIPVPPDTASRSRRTAQELGLGSQPQPAYRTFQGALDLNRGNDIMRRDFVRPSPAYRPGAYSSAGIGEYGSSGSQYAPSMPRSEYFESWDDDATYGRGSTTSSQRDFPLGPQQY